MLSSIDLLIRYDLELKDGKHVKLHKQIFDVSLQLLRTEFDTIAWLIAFLS